MTASISAADAKTFAIDNFRLQSGTVVPAVTIAYRTLGRLATDRNNVVLVTHGNTTVRR
jgi:homoserine O-acetyltransferase